ncbi:Hypothetical Protein RSKD131_1457 [Cereibacter sphaeroides KD131]|nr:Hypothetical Protein RSKD131_1457 [Cereibacter sphaeroides KD131]
MRRDDLLGKRAHLQIVINARAEPQPFRWRTDGGRSCTFCKLCLEHS